MNTITKITPEGFDIANGFLLYGSIEDTAEQMQVPQQEVMRILQQPEIKRYLDGIYLDQGYRNRDRLGRLLDKIIDEKMKEAEESGVYTSKDIVDLMQLAHKMRMDEIKASKEAGPSTAIQVNNDYGGSNTDNLLKKLGVR